MRKVLTVLLAALMLLGAVSTALAEDIEIAVVPKSLDNAIFLDTKSAAEKKGAELGIKIYWEGPTTSDAAQQVNVIESLIERQVDGILVSCNDADALKDVIDRAMDAGIPR
jgi:ribose transport system substrate-binding protein